MDSMRLHDEKCELMDALNAVIQAEGIYAGDDERFRRRWDELMEAGRAWRERLEHGDVDQYAAATQLLLESRGIGDSDEEEAARRMVYGEIDRRADERRRARA
ncbi:MAG: hypothetical protein EG823_03715 [Actinobacteria bacterium]|nr:hypothetical protein [Actinomycetota bacterium]